MGSKTDKAVPVRILQTGDGAGVTVKYCMMYYEL